MSTLIKFQDNICLIALVFICHTSSWAQWENLGSGISSSPHSIFSISAVNEEVVWAVSYNSATGVSYDYTRTIDGGITWKAGLLNDSIGNYYPISIHAIDAQTAWIVMLSTPRQDVMRIFKTNNGGDSWIEQVGGFNTEGFASPILHFFNENEGICFGSPGTGISSIDSLRIYRTQTGGEEWTRISSEMLPAMMPKEGIWIYGDNKYESKGDTLWFGTRASRIFRTTDRGRSWQAFPTGISGNSENPGLASVAFQDAQNGIATTYFPSQSAKTHDGGETWTKITMPSTPRASDIEYVPGTFATYIVNEGYLNESSTSKILLTHDHGQTWETQIFSHKMFVLKFLSPTVGFGGGNLLGGPDMGGMYRWTGNFTTTSSENLILKHWFDVYPNPVKDKLFIQFDTDISFLSHLKLSIYDLLGKCILRMNLDSNLSEIDMNNFTNGIYIYTLSDQDKIMHSGKLIKN